MLREKYAGYETFIQLFGRKSLKFFIWPLLVVQYNRSQRSDQPWRLLKSEERNKPMNDRIREILSWYTSENQGVRTNLARMLNH
jgi:hypothetical protein